jgi:hypothetical protein
MTDHMRTKPQKTSLFLKPQTVIFLKVQAANRGLSGTSELIEQWVAAAQAAEQTQAAQRG